MTEKFSPPAQSGRFTAEARTQAMREADPEARLQLLVAMIEEGDSAMAEFALAALQEMPVDDVYEPDHPSRAISRCAGKLLSTFANKGLFAEADTVVDVLRGVDIQTALEGAIELLKAGHAGPEKEYLAINLDFLLQERPSERPSATIFDYLNGLAAYGEDLLTPETPHSKLLLDAMATRSDPWQREFHFIRLAHSSAVSGRIDRALEFKELITDPFYRCYSNIHIAEEALAQGDTALAASLLEEVQATLPSVRSANEGRERAGDPPEFEATEIEAMLARIYTIQGHIAEAKALVGEIAPAFAYEQATVYAKIYAHTGDLTARTQALKSLVGSPDKASLSTDFIREIGEADLRWGQTMPSLTADNETVPLICWELSGLYSQKNTIDLTEETTEMTPEAEGLLRALGVDPLAEEDGEDTPEIAAIRERWQRQRLEAEDQALTTLIALLASGDAPQSAESLLELVRTPAGRVRALTALARELEARHGVTAPSPPRPGLPTDPDAPEAASSIPATIGDIKTEIINVASQLAELVQHIRPNPFLQAELNTISEATAGSTDASILDLRANLEEASRRVEVATILALFALGSLKQYIEGL